METNQEKKFSINFYQIALGIIMVIGLKACLESRSIRNIPFSEFKKHLSSGEIKNVKIRGESIFGEFNHEQNGKKGFSTTKVEPGFSEELDKYGIPYDADFILDCRFIPNPHWVPELQPLSGQDGAVAKMVLDNPATKDFIKNFLHLFNGTKDGFLQEGKRYLTIAIGCTGGRHRSVAVSEFLANEFKNQKIDTTLNHRDLDR